LFSDARCNPHLHQSNCSRTSWLVVCSRARFAERVAIRCDGDRGGVFGGPWNGPAENLAAERASLRGRASHIGVMATVARVFSHSMRRVQSLAPLSKAIVKFSTGVEVAEAFISARTRSESAPG